ncbi:MAG TPA: enoyl-CoA hydratase/isomerase family protein [Desulfobacterales bacterium]|nr:enoyl-CoA hydratase/isomerase family protein [Desulfobacterales bacterium]
MAGGTKMKGESLILTEVRDGIEIITLNRPKALNSLNSQIEDDLECAIDDALSNDDVKVIIITGSGRAFAAGKDIPEFVEKGGEGMAQISRRDHEIFSKIRKSTKPVIAAINGLALGGGLELAMSCHIRIASEKAILGQPEVSLGAIPGAGGTQLLPRIIGKGAALYYLLTGENIPAKEAHRLGLIDKLVPADMLMPTAIAVAKVISQKGPIAVKQILEIVNKGGELPLDEALRLEEEAWKVCGDSEDFNSAIKAFMEKKPVTFKGR